MRVGISRRLVPVKVGDLVRIKEGVDDPDLPTSRVGLISEITFSRVFGEGGEVEMAIVLFSSGVTLRFHKYFLEVIEEKC